MQPDEHEGQHSRKEEKCSGEVAAKVDPIKIDVVKWML
jgi:hypothetical protein